MTENDKGSAGEKAAVPFARKRNKVQNLVLQGASELAMPLSDRVPLSAYFISIGKGGQFLRQAHSDMATPLTADALAEAIADQGTAAMDLVFIDDSCIDLSFRLPDALLPELRQIIENEIQYRSPFNENASLWFSIAEEQKDGRWRARAAVFLKNRVVNVLDLLADHDIPIGIVRRISPEAEFAARPAWAGHESTFKPAQLLRHLPAPLKMGLLGACVFFLSALAASINNGITQSRTAQQADVARTTLAQQAQSVAGTRQVDQSLSDAADKLAMTGILSNLLPDGVWLDQLIIDDNTVTLIGFSPSAAEITRLLTTLPQLSDIRFASPVTRDNTQSLERFRIVATLNGTS